MIGGRDIVLPGATEADEAKLIIDILRPRWPNLVVQDANSDVPYSHEELEGHPVQLREFFVYRDQTAFASWVKDGATDDNSDSLLHMIIEPDAITFVVREGESETGQLANYIVSVLSEQRAARESLQSFEVFGQPGVEEEEEEGDSLCDPAGANSDLIVTGDLQDHA